MLELRLGAQYVAALGEDLGVSARAQRFDPAIARIQARRAYAHVSTGQHRRCVDASRSRAQRALAEGVEVSSEELRRVAHSSMVAGDQRVIAAAVTTVDDAIEAPWRGLGNPDFRPSHWPILARQHSVVGRNRLRRTRCARLVDGRRPIRRWAAARLPAWR